MNEEKEVLAKLFELVTDYRDCADRKPVINYLSPDELADKIDLSISPDGVSYDRLLDDIKSYLEFGVNTSNKQFLNQLYAGPNFPAFLGEVIAALTNTSIYTYEVAPMATLIEIELLNKMNLIVGYENGEGTFVTGGSNANLLALLCARTRAFPQAKKQGMKNIGAPTIFVSDQAHYSFDTAANVIGLGTNSVRKVESDSSGCMIPGALKSAIENSITLGEKPIFICATAGTTLMGSFDPIAEVAPIAKKHGIWLHVDGAFGGSVVLSDKHRNLLVGLELSDSFTWDPHKLMNVPLICSALLVKTKGTLIRNLTDLDSDYLFHNTDTQSYDLGKASLQCGKRVDVLKLWLAWKYFGDSGYESRMNKLFSLAQYATRKINVHDKLELLASPQSVAVCFRYLPGGGTDIHEFNLELREELRRSGKSLVNYGYIGETVALRFIAANPDLEERDIDQFFHNLLETAAQIEKGHSS